YRGAAGLAVGLIVVSSLLQLVGPLCTAVALDLFIHPDPARTPSGASRLVARALDAAGLAPTPAEGITAAATVMLVVLVVTFAVLYAQGYVMQLMGQRIMA